VPLLDPSGDVYSLGVILYELLTGRHPFTYHAGQVKDVLAKMIPERQAPPPMVRRHNRAVSPAVEAIVRKCLEPDPARRYQHARDLKEDLERQLEKQAAGGTSGSLRSGRRASQVGAATTRAWRR